MPEATTALQGADVEIFERDSGTDCGVIVPNGLRINGQEVLLPSDAKIVVGEISNSDVVQVTVTMFVRSLTIKREI